jgi:hypothetical protein
MIRSITPVPGASLFSVRSIGKGVRPSSYPAASHAQAVDIARVRGLDAMILRRGTVGRAVALGEDPWVDALVSTWSLEGGLNVIDASLVAAEVSQ